ncbi:winged helix-turn-helix transcriptional regulator [Cryptosporangium arvum]|uniref:winged helix-turn-helix transcriptional regulator n=1 Tax=Cryptosporangium arvum TaxID=80871 RepID=UPI001B80D4B8|nr:helix-turn-helix domain-containing protein [Cryptosporangium arvum]
MEVALAAIGGRWTTLVLRDLVRGPLSFGDLRRGLPTVSAKVLTERLTRLQESGLVERRRTAGFPPRTIYRLTAAGRELEPLLVELYRTGAALLEKA